MHSVELPAGRTTLALTLPMLPRLETHGSDGAVVVMRGPLVYAAPRTLAARFLTTKGGSFQTPLLLKNIDTLFFRFTIFY